MKYEYKVLSPLKWSGNINGDYGYEINGFKSDKGYSTHRGASAAMHREVTKLEKRAAQIN